MEQINKILVSMVVCGILGYIFGIYNLWFEMVLGMAISIVWLWKVKKKNYTKSKESVGKNGN